ncbi:hypothetical protein ABK040_013520 [Willaertia magna]
MFHAIYHEKQEASLCAMHALNNLLQGPYFTEIDLMEIARQLDQEEQNLLTDAKDLQEWRKKGSQNVSDEGNFSIEVINKALEVWSVSLIPITHPSCAERVRQNPWLEKAYICNYKEHWFTFRRFGDHWWNLNSVLHEPSYLSPTYISLFLEQLKQEGYSIFIVCGDLPQCEADLLAPTFDPKTHKATPPPKTTSNNNNNSIERIIQMQQGMQNNKNEDEELKRALEMSLMDQEEDELERVLRMSMQQQ